MAMVRNLSYILDKVDCTVQEIRSLLENQSPKSDLEDYHFLILKAIGRKQNVDIVRELLKHLDNADSTSLIFDTIVREACVNLYLYVDKNFYFYSIIQILVRCGANVNVPGTSALFRQIRGLFRFERDFFVPILQLLLKYANESTKTDAIQHFLSAAIKYGFDHSIFNTSSLKIWIQNFELLLKTGTPLKVGLFRYLFETTIQYCPPKSGKMNLGFLLSLYKVVLKHIFMGSFCEDEKLMTYDIKSHFDDIVGRQRENQTEFNNERLFNIKIIFGLVRNLWDNYFLQCHRMNKDVLKNNRSLLQTLKDLYYGECERKVSTKVAYEILLRLSQEEYPCFTHVMSQAVKKSDLLELYSVIASHHFGENDILHPDCYYLVAKLLSKDDQMNFFRAFLPKRKNLQRMPNRVNY